MPQSDSPHVLAKRDVVQPFQGVPNFKPRKQLMTANNPKKTLA
jgi:hypothetical protein